MAILRNRMANPEIKESEKNNNRIHWSGEKLARSHQFCTVRLRTKLVMIINQQDGAQAHPTNCSALIMVCFPDYLSW